MRFDQFSDPTSGSKVYDDLVLAVSPENRGKPWSEKSLDISMADIRPHSLRFQGEGKALEFFDDGRAEEFFAARGWEITRLRQFTSLIRGEHIPRIEVRAEKRGGQAVEHKTETLYHVTSLENLTSIMTKGLLPKTSSRPDMHRYGPRIHLALSLKAAERMKRMFEKYDEKNDVQRFYAILKVDAGAVREPRLDQEFRRDGIYTIHPIPPEAISAS
jgi:hypothetical protein